MLINSYHFGSIVINGNRYSSDVIIYPDRVDGNWWRKQGHQLHIEDLKGVFEERPEVLLVGTGSPGLMRVSPETEDYLEAQRIKKACRILAALRQAGDLPEVQSPFPRPCPKSK